MAFRLVLAAHLACAWGAALIFWVPVVAVKGGPLHLTAGRLYVRLIYLTALTGAPLAVLLYVRAADPAARHTAIFLAYLMAILVMPVFHGVRVARAARGAAALGTPAHRALSAAAIAAGVALFGLGMAWREWPYVLLSPIGPVMGVRALRYSSRLIFPGWLRPRPNREKSTGKNNAWREEHIVAMTVSGIAVHTALLVFGIGRTLGVTLTGLSAYVPWLLPAAVGVPLLVWRIRQEQARPSTSRPPLRTPPPR